jgi:hypothetical protein
MTEQRPTLDDSEFVNALLNLVIPPSVDRNLPGAGTLGLAPAVAAALRADKLLGPLVAVGAEAVRAAALSEHPEGLSAMTPQGGTELLKAQLSAHPVLIMGILRHLCPAYYQQPQVLEAIGDQPRPPFPDGYDVEPTDAELLKKLRARRTV